MLLVCDNASVHKADELKKLMEQYGIILMFLPPNMTQWLQPLDRVVCGLIKIVQRARRGRHLATDLKQWKQEQERIVGEALLNKRPHPTLTPWLPPKPTLMQGIFFYQKTHMEELKLEKTKNAIRQVFIDIGITPFEDGRWKECRRERFTNHRRSPTANQVLSNVLKLQDQKCISAYLFSLGLDDQDHAQWGDAELSHLVVPEPEYASDSEEEGEEEEEQQQQPTCRILWFLNLTIHRTARRRRGRRRRRRRSSSSNSISRRLPSMTRHGKDPGDRRRSVS
jgi:hypothetical protein